VLGPPVYTGAMSTPGSELQPGGRTTVAYSVHVSACPSTGPVPDQGWQVQLSVRVAADHGFSAIQDYDVDLSSLVAAACGLSG
jgi:hypothetical protein